MSDWQPIETAPKDGTRILAYFPKPGIVGISCWHTGTEFQPHWMWDERPCPVEPSHWMPFPGPPKATKG